MELKNPYVFYFGIIFVIVICFFMYKKKQKEPYKSGKKVANTELIKQNAEFKKIFKKYRVYHNLIKIFCFACVFITFILIARPVEVLTENSNIYTRDIFLCLDVSGSMDEINKNLVNSLKDTVRHLKGERIGIIIFNTSSVMLAPLTDDYEYILETLDELHNACDENGDMWYLFSGTLMDNETRGSSLVSDGLATCAYSFTELEEERTRIIILSTDNDVNGEPLVTLPEAVDICNKNNITVYGVGPVDKFWSQGDIKGLKKNIEKTGGKYYEGLTANEINEIVKEIEAKIKNPTEIKNEQAKIDKPEVSFILLVVSFCILNLLCKKVKI